MKKIILFLSLMTLLFSQKDNPQTNVEAVLDNLHQYASEANSVKYINLFATDAVFFGTDISERWNKNEFNNFVLGNDGNYFKSSSEISKIISNERCYNDKKIFVSNNFKKNNNRL